MAITARYSGKCSKCGGFIPAGAQVNWDRDTKTISHVGKCPAKSGSAATSTKATTSKATTPKPKPQSITTEQQDAILTAQGRSWALRLDGSGLLVDAMEYTREGKEGPKVGEIVKINLKLLDGKTREPHPALVIATNAPYYHSASTCDEMDCFCGRYGWKTPYTARRVTRTAEEEQVEARRKLEATVEGMFDLPRGVVVSDRGTGTLTPEYAQVQRTRVWSKTVGYSLHEGYRTADGVLTCKPVYDDSPVWRFLPWAEMSAEIADYIRAMEVK